VGETVIANKTKLGAADALALAKKAKRVVAARGKQVTTLDLKKDSPTDESLLAVLLGPTGNLRAPTAVVGDTLVVGFNPEAYQQVLG
jgi:arsenate reductase-like glutaredoxin family protein